MILIRFMLLYHTLYFCFLLLMSVCHSSIFTNFRELTTLTMTPSNTSCSIVVKSYVKALLKIK